MKKVISLLLVMMLLLSGTATGFAATAPKLKVVSEVYGAYLNLNGEFINYIVIEKSGVTSYYREPSTTNFMKGESTKLVNEISKKASISAKFGTGEEGYTWYLTVKKDSKGLVQLYEDFGDGDTLMKTKKFKDTKALLDSIAKDPKYASIIKKEKAAQKAEAEKLAKEEADIANSKLTSVPTGSYSSKSGLSFELSPKEFVYNSADGNSHVYNIGSVEKNGFGDKTTLTYVFKTGNVIVLAFTTKSDSYDILEVIDWSELGSKFSEFQKEEILTAVKK